MGLITNKIYICLPFEKEVDKLDWNGLSTEEYNGKTYYKIPSGGNGKDVVKKITFETLYDNVTVTLNIVSSSEQRYDFAYACELDGTSGYSNAKYKISGDNQSITCEYVVPHKGSHWIYIGYRKDGSGNQYNDCGYFSIDNADKDYVIRQPKEVYLASNKMNEITYGSKKILEYGKNNIIKWSGKRSIDFNNYIDKATTLGISYSYKDYTTNKNGLNRNGVAYLYDDNVNSYYDLNKLYFWNNPKCKNIRLGFTYDNNFDGKNIYSNITYSIDFSDIDFSRISYIDNLFLGWHGLNSIKLPNDFAKGKKSLVKLFGSTNNRYRKDGCNMIKSLDIANCDISDVTDIRQMFMGCAYIDKLDIGKWDTSNVVNMEGTFSQYIEKDSFQTNCAPLKFTIIDVSNWNVSNVTNMACMFKYCSSLTTLDLSRWDVSNVTNMSYIFEGCSELTTLIAGHESDNNVTALNGLKVDIDLSDCTKLNSASISAICNGLANLPSDNKKTITVSKTKENDITVKIAMLNASIKNWNTVYK